MTNAIEHTLHHALVYPFVWIFLFKVGLMCWGYA